MFQYLAGFPLCPAHFISAFAQSQKESQGNYREIEPVGDGDACNPGPIHHAEHETGGYFEGGASKPGVIDNRQWLEAIINGTEPVVKPEQAFVVTQILEAIYQSAEIGKEIILSIPELSFPQL